MMHMTFYWGKYVTILFDTWRTTTWLSYSLSLVALFVVAAFYQYLEERRIKLKLRTKVAKKSSTQTPLLRRPIANRSANKVAIALFFGINSAIGYMLMLAVMSFNGGVIVAVCFGFAVGYLIWRSGDDEEDDMLVVENPCACA